MARGRKIAHFDTGGAATAQGLPAATGSLGYTPDGSNSAVGSWGTDAITGGIAGDASVSPQGAPNAWTGDQPGDYVPPPAPLPAAAPDVAAAPSPYDSNAGGPFVEDGILVGDMDPGDSGPGLGGIASGGAIPAQDFRSGGSVQKFAHGGFTKPGWAQPQQSTPAPRPMPETGILTTDSSGMQRNTNSNPDANGYDPATGFTTPGSRGSQGGGGGEKGKGPPHDPAADSDSAGGEGLVQSLKNPPSSGGQQQSGSSGGQSGWSGGTNNLPPAAAPSSDASSGIPTDAGSTPAGPSPDAGAGGAGAAGMAKGGPVINPTEEPYRNKWRAKNGQKQAPYKAFADGGDTGAIPIDPDQGQEGQTGDDNLQAMQGVKAALTATRQQFGLSDKAFQMASQQLAGNIPAKPAGPGGDQPPLNPFPTKTPATPFGTKTSDSGEDNDTQSAAGGGPMYPILHTSKAAPKGPQRPANVDPTTWQDQANSRDDPGKVTPQEDDPETNIYGEDMKEIPGSGQQDPAEGGKGGRIPRGPPRADDSFGGSDSDSSGSSSGSDSGGGLSVSSARGGAIPMKSGWK